MEPLKGIQQPAAQPWRYTQSRIKRVQVSGERDPRGWGPSLMLAVWPWAGAGDLASLSSVRWGPQQNHLTEGILWVSPRVAVPNQGWLFPLTHNRHLMVSAGIFITADKKMLQRSLWVKARDAAEHPTVPRTALQQRIIQPQMSKEVLTQCTVSAQCR